jgi:hypothetical protein
MGPQAQAAVPLFQPHHHMYAALTTLSRTHHLWVSQAAGNAQPAGCVHTPGTKVHQDTDMIPPPPLCNLSGSKLCPHLAGFECELLVNRLAHDIWLKLDFLKELNLLIWCKTCHLVQLLKDVHWLPSTLHKSSPHIPQLLFFRIVELEKQQDILLSFLRRRDWYVFLQKKKKDEIVIKHISCRSQGNKKRRKLQQQKVSTFRIFTINLA